MRRLYDAFFILNTHFSIFFQEMIMASKKVEVAGIMGPIWFIGWLFTIGLLELSFFKGFLAIIVWPYYLGELIRTFIK
jgi:hypothetical protein